MYIQNVQVDIISSKCIWSLLQARNTHNKRQRDKNFVEFLKKQIELKHAEKEARLTEELEVRCMT